MRTWLKIVAWFAGVVGFVAFVLLSWVLEIWTVPSDDPLLAAAIEPTLSAGDVVLVTRRASVGRGHLLRCADPQAPGRFVVARAIARFGDHLDLNDEVVSIDGHRAPSPRACDPPSVTLHDPRYDEDVTLGCALEEFGDMPFGVLRSSAHPEKPSHATVEANRWFLLSDDRHIHLDSRDYGAIDPNTCQHLVFRLFGAGGLGDRRRLTVIW